MVFSNTLANAIRFLSVDAVEQAQSGHPGMPLGMADVASVLWKKFLRHSPKNPHWFNRDRFVLSNGHGSMLLYALLHLTGYKLDIEALKHFRQLHSQTPGHPECTETPGVETTTGPLGQGLANAVGMAIAERVLAAQFNDSETALINHHTYVFVGDGCLMEGISHEACSFAGTLQLGKLIAFYDDNGISIDGPVDSWFNDDTRGRFEAYHWQVIGPIDGHDQKAIEAAIIQAQEATHQPSLIICKTIIGHGSLAAGQAKTHGAPLGHADIAQLRKRFDWPYAPFEIPPEIYAAWDHTQQGECDEQQWLMDCHRYQTRRPEDYHAFLRRINGDLPDDWLTYSANFIQQTLESTKALATRKASQQCIEAYAAYLPELLGGSADLTESNNTNWSKTVAISAKQFNGNYLHYGVREFAMSAILNGIALHGGFIPYGGTFLVFADYARNALRLSALMKQRVIYIYTHDSIGLGEDGPTHQPIEHASMLRMTPNMQVWRPADLAETAVAWQQALARHNGPSSLLLSRQALPALKHTPEHATTIARGGYILLDCDDGKPEVILIATGSEVQLAVDCATKAQTLGVQVRVVSMPCAERFLLQDKHYQEQVLPHQIRKRIAIEAAATAFWYRFVGLDGVVIGIDTFGQSAPAIEVYQSVGITLEKIMATLLKISEENYDITCCD